MPHDSDWAWELSQKWTSHEDRHAFLRAIPFTLLDNPDSAPAGDRPSPMRQGQALSVNLSPGGMLLLVQGKLAPQQRLRVVLPPRSMKGPLPSTAEVRWIRSVPALLKNDVYFVGIKFLRPQ